MEAVGVDDPARCVYVGDRLFDDIWGAHNAGLRAIHIPHSRIPVEQVGHTEGEPDAVAHRLVRDPRDRRRLGLSAARCASARLCIAGMRNRKIVAPPVGSR